MMSKLNKVKNALTSIEGLKVYHYWHPRLEAPFCIWAEDGEGDSLWSSNHMKEQIITGYVDYFTKEELDPMVDAIQNSLNQVEGLGWNLSAVLYENETNLIHYSWDFQVI